MFACVKCNCKTNVKNTRSFRAGPGKGSQVRRLRECPRCGLKQITVEAIANPGDHLMVAKDLEYVHTPKDFYKDEGN